MGLQSVDVMSSSHISRRCFSGSVAPEKYRHQKTLRVVTLIESVKITDSHERKSTNSEVSIIHGGRQKTTSHVSREIRDYNVADEMRSDGMHFSF